MTVFLETKGLRKRFGDLEAVAGLDLRVREGEIYAFLGPNGAGKTTTLRMLAGLLRPTEGEVRVGGEPVAPGLPGRTLVGVCPQENVLYPELTARENLEYVGVLHEVPRRLRRERADDLLARVGLVEKAKVRADRLSGGMKRRLTFAMALMQDPPVVVLDEPEAGLDPQSRVHMRELIREIRDERTVVLTSHNMDEVERVADRVAIIDHGKLVAEDTPEALKRQHARGDHAELCLADGADLLRIVSTLKTGGFDARALDGRVAVSAPGLAAHLAGLVGSITQEGGRVEDLRFRGATLEDVFISLTGRGLRD